MSNQNQTNQNNEVLFDAKFMTNGTVHVVANGQKVSSLLQEVSTGINENDRQIRLVHKNFEAVLSPAQFGKFNYFVGRLVTSGEQL